LCIDPALAAARLRRQPHCRTWAKIPRRSALGTAANWSPWRKPNPSGQVLPVVHLRCGDAQARLAVGAGWVRRCSGTPRGCRPTCRVGARVWPRQPPWRLEGVCGAMRCGITGSESLPSACPARVWV
jgi:hypothetical protein